MTLSLAQIAKELNRPLIYLSGLQNRFELPRLSGSAYSEAYCDLLRCLVTLRRLNVAEDSLVELWEQEKKLLTLIHADTTGSPTWFLDSRGATTHPDRRLLLTQHDMGVSLAGHEIQIGLDFAPSNTELFTGPQMGEDALRVLRKCLEGRARIMDQIALELPPLREALKWGSQILKR